MPHTRVVTDQELEDTWTRIPLTKRALRNFIRRIEAPVKGQDGCVMWTGYTITKDQKGQQHGRTHWKGRSWLAHRMSYTIWVDDIPNGKHVLHSCPIDSEGRCVNPRHLSVGTPKDNAEDSARRGNRAQKLDHLKVRQIRELSASGWTQKRLGEEFGVCGSQISLIVNPRGKVRSWKHVE